jgi:uncharacterized protein (DUF2147 family)
MIAKHSRMLALLVASACLIITIGCGDTSDSTPPPSDPPEAVESTPVSDAAATDVAPTPPPPPDPADAVIGHWYTADDDSQVLISKENGEIGGKIIWLKSPNYDEEGDEEFGKPKHDANNPDEDLQDRPIVGLAMMHGFSYDTDDKNWSGGTIYDPESGKTYKCQMSLGDGDTLDVRGYIGIPQLGRTEVWRRVPEGEEKSEETPTPSA